MLPQLQIDMRNTYSNPRVRNLCWAALAATTFAGGGGSLVAAGVESDRKLPIGLSASDWDGIRAAHERGRHAIVETTAGGFAAANPRQGWRTEFDESGFLTKPREGDWAWGLELRAVREGDVEINAGSADENRLAFARGSSVFEWFVNRSGGLQQGWTILERPETGTDSRLSLELGVRGTLRARVGETSVDFVDPDGSKVLTYGGLLAWDAEGRKLPVKFAALDDGIAIEVDDRGARYPLTIDPVAQVAYVKASNTDANDAFGSSVAMSGDTVVVGAPEEDSTAADVDGDDTNDGGNNVGAAYVFSREGGVWSQQGYLKASNPGDGDRFGYSVAIWGDVIVVGAPNEDSGSDGVNSVPDNVANDAGAAYTFLRFGDIWTAQSYLKASNSGFGDRFGESVAVVRNTIVVGAPREDSGATMVDGPSGDGTSEAGAAYAFFYNGFFWAQDGYLKASDTSADDEFGTAVALLEDFDTQIPFAFVGAPFEDQAAIDSGAVYPFLKGASWIGGPKVKASNAGPDDEFGHSVAASGPTPEAPAFIVVGAPMEDSPGAGVNGNQGDGANNAGAAYVFEASGGLSQIAYLKAIVNDDGVGNNFGSSVAISGNLVIVGAPGEDSDSVGVNGSQENLGANGSGAAFVYRRAGGNWIGESYLKASNTGAGDSFGSAVAVSGESAIVGAPGEDSAATGVNGDQGVGANASGAAYTYSLTPVSGGGGGGGSTGGGSVDVIGPDLRVRGRKTIETLRKRVVIRGTASDASGVSRIEVKAAGAKVAKTKLKGGRRWKAVLRVRKDRGRVIVKIRAVDNVGNRSKPAKFRILRR